MPSAFLARGEGSCISDVHRILSSGAGALAHGCVHFLRGDHSGVFVCKRRRGCGSGGTPIVTPAEARVHKNAVQAGEQNKSF